MYNFDSFITVYQFMLESCQYPYYKTKSIDILRRLFFNDTVSTDDIKFLEKQTEVSVSKWLELMTNHNQSDINIDEQPMDANNICTAP